MNAVVPAETRQPLATGGAIKPVIPQTMEDAYRLGKAIAQSGMAPKGMETPEKCMVAIMHGLEIGLPPMTALQRIAVVNGRPTLWGDGAMSLVRGSGLCEYVEEEIAGAGNDRVAKCTVKRKGERSPTVRTFSVQDAKTANLWGKSGPWQQFPERMLQMRARAFALRDLFADVLGGMYLREEIEEDKREAAPTPMAPPPAQPKPLEAAKPAEKVEDAEIIDNGEPQIDGDYSRLEGGYEDTAVDPFDAEAWLEDAATQFAGCKTPQDVDDAHEVFSDTMETMLTREQRERYQAMHMEAAERLEQASAAGAIEEAAPEPAAPPAAAASSLDDDEDEHADLGEAYIARGNAVLEDPARTRDSIAAFWVSTKDERLALKREGHLSAEAATALNARLKAVDAELAAAEKGADDETAPEPAAPPAADDPIQQFDREYRAKLASINSVTELHAYVESTLKRRNELANGDDKLMKAWRQAKIDRQAVLNGVAPGKV